MQGARDISHSTIFEIQLPQVTLSLGIHILKCGTECYSAEVVTAVALGGVVFP